MLSYDVCDELTVCRVNRVTSWSCAELTGSRFVIQKVVYLYATFDDSRFSRSSDIIGA